jgi:hypothetical protein
MLLLRNPSKILIVITEKRSVTPMDRGLENRGKQAIRVRKIKSSGPSKIISKSSLRKI